MPRFAGPATFARLPRVDEVAHADVAVLGVPFDAGTTYRPGARFGPEAIRAGSKLLRPYHVGLGVEPWTALQVADAGDVSANPFDIAEAVGQIERAANALSGKADRIVTLGGDHTVALPLLRAVHAQHGPVALIHFDAHLDTWDTYFGARYTHGTPFRRASEEGLLAIDHCAHVGIRNSVFAPTDFDDDRRLGFATVTSLDVARRGVDEALDRIRERVASLPVYISVDIDVLDPAHAPGTGTPEPGGLTTRELQLFLHGLADLPVVGADVVEVSPAYDHAQLTALAAAGVVYDLLAMLTR
jgi:agmatinase